MTTPDTILEIETDLRLGRLNTNPQACAEARAKLSGEYSFYAGQLEDVLKIKPALWNSRRPDFKSDAACDRWFEATADGINETGLNLKLKRIEKLMQGLNSLLKLHEGQAHNQY